MPIDPYLSAIGTAVATAIAVLFKTILASQKKMEARAEICEKKHEEAGGKILDLSTKVASLEAREDAYGKVSGSLEALTQGMLELLNTKEEA